MQNTQPSRPIRPILLSGADDGGLWPLARGESPSQLQPLFGEKSPLQQTATTLNAPELFLPPIVVADARHRFLIAQQLIDIDVHPESILLEPKSCGAFAAAAAAIARLVDTAPTQLALITPSDQSVRQRDRPAFRRAMYAATPLAEAGVLVAFAAPIRSWICHRQHFAEDLIDA
ncbi:MAG: sugar phosphate nucleotidyltransferase, partial [Alphaproteobacteria bacterium]